MEYIDHFGQIALTGLAAASCNPRPTAPPRSQASRPQTADQPAADHPTPGQPAADQQTADQPAAGQCRFRTHHRGCDVAQLRRQSGYTYNWTGRQLPAKADQSPAARETMTMRLALHTWGSPDAGKTALLIHGVMSSYGSWVRVAPELAGRGYYVIAPDLRGHGNSPHADSYTSEDFAGDLVESLPEGADVAIGHSLGGRSLLLAVDALAPARAVYSDPAWVLSGAAAEVIAIMQEFAEATKVMTERHIQQLNPRWAVEDVASEKAGFAAWDVK